VLGPRGYGVFVLGMSKTAVLAVGGLVEAGTDTHCTAYRAKDGTRLVVADQEGLVNVTAPAGAHTPEGVRVGSTIEEVRAAYPTATEFRAGFATAAPGSSDASYSFESDAPGNPFRPTDKISKIAVGRAVGNCTLALY
jgi:hypothetical protein